jgi:hypothetical protein
MTPVPTEEQVKEWVREANHNEPMFYQVACMAAAWGYMQSSPTSLENKVSESAWASARMT